MRPPLAAGSAGDTIFALASGLGRSAISVVRLSGPACGPLIAGLCGKLPTPRTASLRSLHDQAGSLLDRALVLWFPGPASYTGEDSAELHLHGSRAVLGVVTDAMMQAGARPAEPGEFTRRAYLHGKMDLLEAEAVADLTDAETDLQRLQALRQLSGGQSRLIQGWTAQLIKALAWQEAQIDFSEEAAQPEVEEAVLADLTGLRDTIRAHLATAPSAERLRRGLLFVIAGAPNVGKSSLLNALAGRDAAMVSRYPGTTRDVVSVDLVLAGIPITIADTAGLRETIDPLEQEGIRRGRLRMTMADLVLAVTDARSGKLPDFEQPHLAIANKVDLAATPDGCIGVSALTGEGMTELKTRLAARAQALVQTATDPVLTRARHLAALREVEASLSTALLSRHPELRAEDMRVALQALARITGGAEAEMVLDEIFSAFCIGK